MTIPTPSALAAIAQLAAEVQQVDLEAARARARLVKAIKDAEGSVSQVDIAKAAGLSRQRVGQLLQRGTLVHDPQRR